jgi:hypothetical protein
MKVEERIKIKCKIYIYREKENNLKLESDWNRVGEVDG